MWALCLLMSHNELTSSATYFVFPGLTKVGVTFDAVGWPDCSWEINQMLKHFGSSWWLGRPFQLLWHKADVGLDRPLQRLVGCRGSGGGVGELWKWVWEVSTPGSSVKVPEPARGRSVSFAGVDWWTLSSSLTPNSLLMTLKKGSLSLWSRGNQSLCLLFWSVPGPGAEPFKSLWLDRVRII